MAKHKKLLRLDPDLHKKISDMARQRCISEQAQITDMLLAYFKTLEILKRRAEKTDSKSIEELCFTNWQNMQSTDKEFTNAE